MAYLPLFLVARAVVIVRLRQLDRAEQGDRGPLGLGPALGLATGISLLSLVGTSVVGTVVAVGGGVLVLVAATWILPAGTLVARPGRPAAILLMRLLCAVHFDGHAVVAITAHDLLGRTGARELHLVGWVLTGAGMGLAYVDTLNRVLDEPTAPDGIGTHVAAQALVMAEVIGTALLATVTASALAWVLSAPIDRAGFAAGVYLSLGVLALLLIPLAQRSAEGSDVAQVGFRRRS